MLLMERSFLLTSITDLPGKKAVRQLNRRKSFSQTDPSQTDDRGKNGQIRTKRTVQMSGQREKANIEETNSLTVQWPDDLWSDQKMNRQAHEETEQ